MSDIDKRLVGYMLLGQLFSENQEQKVKKVKFKASIPIGHRMKQIEGVWENVVPLDIETAKEVLQKELRKKFNKTIPFNEVQIETFEVVE